MTVTNLSTPGTATGDYRSLTEDATIERLKFYIKNPPINSRVFRITPKVANYIKDNCTPNDGAAYKQRRKSQKSIDRYAKAMKAGKWYLTGATIVLTKGELLGDAQHRVDACIESGCHFDTHVVFGVPDKYFAWMDIGKSRSNANALQSAGFKYDVECAAAVRWLIMFDKGTVKAREQIENSEILDYAKKHRGPLVDDDNSVIQSARIAREASVGEEPIGTLAALLWQFRAANPKKAAQFEAALHGDPTADKLSLGIVKAVRHKLKVMKDAAQGRIKEVPRLAHYVTAWNYFVRGNTKQGTSIRGYTWTDAFDFPTVLG